MKFIKAFDWVMWELSMKLPYPLSGFTWEIFWREK